MHKTISSNNNHLSEIFRKICLLVYLFVSDRSKWIFPAEIGISHSRKDVQYSSAQHDTLEIDYYSFWYRTESGEKEEFLYCSHGVKSIIINGVSAEENPDANTLIRLSKAINAAEAEFIYEHLRSAKPRLTLSKVWHPLKAVNALPENLSLTGCSSSSGQKTEGIQRGQRG